MSSCLLLLSAIAFLFLVRENLALKVSRSISTKSNLILSSKTLNMVTPKCKVDQDPQEVQGSGRQPSIPQGCRFCGHRNPQCSQCISKSSPPSAPRTRRCGGWQATWPWPPRQSLMMNPSSTSLWLNSLTVPQDWDLILNPLLPTSVPPTSLPSSAPSPSLRHSQRPKGPQHRSFLEGINSRNNGHFSNIYIAFSFQDCKWYITDINTINTVAEQIEKLEVLNKTHTNTKDKKEKESPRSSALPMLSRRTLLRESPSKRPKGQKGQERQEGQEWQEGWWRGCRGRKGREWGDQGRPQLERKGQ